MFVEKFIDSICWTLVNHASFTLSKKKKALDFYFFPKNLCLFLEQKSNPPQYIVWAQDYQHGLHNNFFFF